MRELGKIPEPGDRIEVPVPDRSDPHEPRERLVTLTVERMDGLRIDRLDLRVVTPDSTPDSSPDSGPDVSPEPGGGRR
jgi:CBS domain containing-hemolysin-like protein